ncbi:MAG: STAS domain-containing protein [Treponema sp.]|nr:STAS domain-containing protein [Treponema sp.]
MKHLTVSEKKGQNYSVFELHGDFTAYTMGDFQKKLDDIIVTESVVLDLSKVTELDASGWGIFLLHLMMPKALGINYT